MTPLRRAVLVSFAALLVSMAIPAIVLHGLGHGELVSVGLLGAMCAAVVSVMSQWRVSAVVTVPLAVASAVAVTVASSPWLAALLMAVVATARGATAAYGFSGPLTTVPVVVGFVVAEPPTTTGSWPPWLSVGLVTLLCAAWAALVMFLVRRHVLTLPRAAPLTPTRALLYGLVSALMVGGAAWFVVEYQLAHAGGWLMLTIVVVFEPYLKDGYVKALHRAGGTIVGFIIAFIIGSLTESPALLSIAGVLCLLVAVDLISRRRPYWQFAAFLTPAVVLLAGSGGSVYEMDGLRLAATLVGVAVVLVVMAIIRPFARRYGVPS